MRQPTKAQAGDGPAAREIGPLTQTDIVRFAGAGGDFNPLHHDPDFATSAGFSGVIAMGQMHAGMLAGFLSDWLGVEHLREYEIRFAAPVFIGDVLRLSARIVQLERDNDHSIADIELSASRGDDTVATAAAKATVTSA